MHARPQLGMLGSAVDFIDASGSRLGLVRPPIDDEAIRQRHRTGCSMFASTTIMRADLFHRAGGYRQGLNISEDYDLFTRMSELSEMRPCPDPWWIPHPPHQHHCAPAAAHGARLLVRHRRRHGASARPGRAFSMGRPNLRRALAILGMSRQAARRQLRWRSASTVLVRKLICLPVPPMARALVMPVLRRSGLKWLHARCLRASFGGPGFHPEPLPLAGARQTTSTSSMICSASDRAASLASR